MRRTEYEEKKKALEDELRALEKEQIEEDYNRWTPEMGQTYYHLDADGDTFDARWNDDLEDRYRYEIGNCFRTKQAVVDAFETLKVIAELKEFADPANVWDRKKCHRYLAYNYDTQKILILDEQSIRTHDIYFASVTAAEAAIKTIGEDRIKKYYLGIL